MPPLSGGYKNLTKMDISQQIRQARLANGVSIRQLAAAAGVSKTTVTNIEQGHKSATVSLVQRMLAVLGYELTIIKKE